MIKTFFAVCLILSATAAAKTTEVKSNAERAIEILGSEGAAWKPISQGDRSVGFLLESKVTRESNIARAWVLTVYLPKQKSSNGKTFGSSMMYYEVDCSESKYRDLDYIMYSNQNRTGEIVYRQDGEDFDWTRAVPGSIVEVEIDAICNPRAAAIKTPRPSVPLPSFQYLQSSDGQSKSALSGNCTFVENEVDTVECRITQTGIRQKASHAEVLARQQEIRAQAAAEPFDTNHAAAICSELAKSKPKDQTALDLKRAEIFWEACSKNTQESWINAIVLMEGLNEMICAVSSLDAGTFRLRWDGKRWNGSNKYEYCEQDVEVRIDVDDGAVKKYTQVRRRHSRAKECASFAAESRQVFSSEPIPIAVECKEAIFGF